MADCLFSCRQVYSLVGASLAGARHSARGTVPDLRTGRSGVVESGLSLMKRGSLDVGKGEAFIGYDCIIFQILGQG